MDEAKLYLIGFKCQYVSGDITLSTEHDSFKWVNKNNYKEVDDGSVYFQALEKYFANS